jgi:hypothetical protein
LVVNKSLKNYIKIFIKFLAILLSNVKNSRRIFLNREIFYCGKTSGP